MKERHTRAPAWWSTPGSGPPWWHGTDDDAGSGGGFGRVRGAGGPVGAGPRRTSASGGRRLPWPSTVLLTAVVLVGTHAAAQGQRGSGRAELDGFALLLLLLGCGVLLWRQRHPVAVVLTTAAVVMVYLGAGYPYGPVFLAVAVACFGAVVTGHRRAAWAAVAMLWAGHVVVAHWLYRALPPSGDAAASWGQEAVVAAWVAAVVAVGELVGVRREQWARERAERARAARRRADEERLRMARELHDVLAHSISVINVQAGVGLALLDSDPEQARTALTTIKAASKEALGEVRQVLDRLRTPGEAPRAPAPGLDRLPELVAQAADAGLGVEVEGTPPKLPPGADLAAFRIVQEALTNVVRHSGSRHARVTLTSGEGVLRLRIDDDGPATGADAGGSGNGLAGMRERAAGLGGTIEAGTRADGGFRVLAVLPLRASAADGTPEPPATHGPSQEER
ncbi:sensor histidine kinase [Streptomyces sp. B3I8]|uniref:sensor histidine kinase n=1 Tax=Streptomyces sp. B3I8 TaxID=3042303 RepID=UPI002785D275|nr:sensor histidine kinase [Streptomyces sp. B3I8]MDQ0785562.1 signal transduction histidine kinase [Streptomyces sp. B3I8]